MVKREFKDFKEKGKIKYDDTKIGEIDYKNLALLSKFCSSQGKIFSRKRARASAGFQRKIGKALKRARYMGLLPYVG